MHQPCHTFEVLCDPKIYFEEHPEYYSLWEGIPAGNTLCPLRPACLTNPDMLKIVIQNVRALLAVMPNASSSWRFHKTTTAGIASANCAAVDAEGGPAGFCSALSTPWRRTSKDYPNALVRTLSSLQAAQNHLPRHNVIIRYCTIEAASPCLDDPSCEKNKGAFKEEPEWGKICDKISIWDYTRTFPAILRRCSTLKSRDNVLSLPTTTFPCVRAGHRIPRIRAIGSLKAYLLARLLWNPHERGRVSSPHGRLSKYYGPDGITSRSICPARRHPPLTWAALRK